MQRYHATSCTSAVNNSAIGGTSARDATRADSSSLPANFSVNSRRSTPLTPYKLKCDKEPLNSRLGPPDFHPQTPNCTEETLTREYVQNGYKETVEGLEEVREISLTQSQTFSKPVVIKCREAIRKCLRAINESRAQKRKAGQVYGVPLSGSLLTKPGVFPEQRACGEDFRKKWIEGLSQQHKRLRSLADHVPHGYRKRSLFEVLIRNNVPLLRATWFIKVTYLNQVRHGSSNTSSGAPDKVQLSRSELWTKDVIDYLQHLVDEIFSRNNSHSTLHSRDRSPQTLYTGSLQQRSGSAAVIDGEDPSLYFKWWYMVRLVQWHNAEGLLLPSYIIDWVLNQLKEKELLEILQLVLPIIYGVSETVVLSQTYIRSLVGIATYFIREPSPGGSDLVDNSRRAYTISALAEMLRYFILAVPDTFVGLECFPLMSCVVSYAASDGNFVSKASEDAGKMMNNSIDAACVFRGKGFDAQYQSLSFDLVISAIQRRADNLAKGASPGYPGHIVAKAVQALDKALLLGDVRGAYNLLFEDLCDGAVDESWIAEVSSCLRSSLKWIGTVSLSFVCSVFFICEWATCDFRDLRTVPPNGIKFTGRKDFSQIYVAIRLLKQTIRDLHTSSQWKNENTLGINNLAKGFRQRNNYTNRNFQGNGYEIKNHAKRVEGLRINSSDIFETPGPLHDIIVCWIDQHEVQKGEGGKRVQHFIMELVRAGIFYPQAYVRQLIVSGILDMNGLDLNRSMRHHRILKQFPGLFLRDALEEARIAEGSQLSEAMHIYSNERRLVLHELLSNQSNNVNVAAQKQKCQMASGSDGASSLVDQWKTILPTTGKSSGKKVKSATDIEELKASIAVLLQLPSSSATSADSVLDESQGSVKRSLDLISNKMDPLEGTPGCEDCKRVKRQNLNEDWSSVLQIPSPIHSDDEDMWWVRKGPKPIESFKVDPPLKSTKQGSRSRQKTVRRTQSLAQLAASRIEGSQGASTSHVCENKVSCPHHKTGVEGETLKSFDGVRTACYRDVVSIGNALKKLRIVEKRTITVWLISAVRQYIEAAEKTVAKVGQFNRPFVPVDSRSSVQWRLSEDELSVILYFMDVCNDLVSAAKFLLWLLPRVLSSPSSMINSGRNILMLSRNAENHACRVGEAFLLSSLRRYENILVATDLIPEALSATMHRAAIVMASNGRFSGSVANGYALYLLKKYGNVASVIEWEKNFKATCDKRLLSELESGRSLDGELGVPLGVPAGVEDPDDYLRQKISGGRLSRVGLSMIEVVHRHMEKAFHYFYERERKLFAAGSPKSPAIDKSDGESQIAQQIIIGLMDCIRQTGGAAQEGDPSLLSSAVSAIVGNVVQTMAKIPDFTTGSNLQNYQSTTGSLTFARRILRIHITCLCLLKEALGERQSRVFEIALATEASCALAADFTPGKASRSQFQSSPEAHDHNANMSNDISNNSTKASPGRASKITAAISALIIGAVLHGVTSLERMVTVFRLKEGLDVIQFVRSTKSNSNGSARSIGTFKVDNSVEVHVHWFRLLVGNCRTVSDGLVVELLGEPSIVAFSRMQRMLPLSLVFPPAYLIFSFVLWRPFILNSSLATREDIHQLYQSLRLAIGDAIRHLPFRDVCLRDSQGFYDLVAADSTDAEFAAMLELNGLDIHLKYMAFVPLRARLFLNAIIDCKMPPSIFKQDDFNRVSGHTVSKSQHAENETKLLDKLVHILDSLQPAKFHWQWVELRLLLNEQALIERLENHDTSLADAIRSSSPSPEKAAASENENNFIEIILTRLLVRPDAAPLFSELVHLFGRSLEDSMLLQAKWFLGGNDVLFGRKTIRQRLINIAESKGLSTKAQFWKPWGWVNLGHGPGLNRGDKKLETTSLEEGEVVEEGIDSKRHGKGSNPIFVSEGTNISQQHVTERAFIELVLPCIDQSSDDSRNTFASDLIKQLNNIEQHINSVTRGANKPTGSAPSGIEGSTNKGNNRKSIRGGSPGLVRRPPATADPAPSFPAALRASMSLRLQFLLRLLPIIYTDGEPSNRNMRYMLASVILRLLGSRVVHEDADLSFYPMQSLQLKREVESLCEAPSAPCTDFSGESLFDQLLLVLYGLLSSCQPSWLRSKPASKSSNNSSKDFSGFDREIAESLQNDLDRMQLPDTVRWRIQAAMPILSPSVRCALTCQPPSVPVAALASLQPSISVYGASPGNSNPPQRNPVPLSRSATNQGKSKPFPLSLQPDGDAEIDPWTLLEDGAGSGPSSSNTAAIGSGDQANLRAASWLKGAIRVRRTDLTYIGAVDDDS